MLHGESPRNFFHFLTSRTVDYNKLRGVIFDYACGLHQYILNREPAQFETVRFLVDGCHWTSMKKTKFQKKSQPGSASGGHTGCSESYNFNNYKQYTLKDNCVNSQNREQLHSTLSKLGKSLRQMSYQNFMRYLIAFFAISNMSKMNKI